MGEMALAKLDPAVQQMIDMAVEARIGTALERQRTEIMGSAQGLEAAMNMAEKLAITGILGTNDKGVVLKLYMLAKDEGIPVTQVQSRWHVWDQGGKLTTQRKAESMLADYRKAGGRVKWIETSPTRVVAAFKASSTDAPVVIVCDAETVKRAKLDGRPIHGTYGEDMKVWYVIRRGVRRTMPECLTGDPLPGDFDDDMLVDDDFEVNPDDIPKATVQPSAQAAQPAQPQPTIDVAAEVRRAASGAKKKWHPDGKPTAADFQPAWEWLSIRLGRQVTGPADVQVNELDEAKAVFELGREEVALRLATESQRQAETGAAVDAEFEENTQVDEDDPFGNVE